MSDVQSRDESARPVSKSPTSDNAGTLVAWTFNSGDATKSHIVHIDGTGLAWVLGIKKPEEFGRLVGEMTKQPAEAATLIEGQKGGRLLPREQLARVAYTEQLNQLTIVDIADKKQHIPDGKEGEQGQIFEAVQQHLGGTPREEDADAWSVMKSPLFALAVVAAIGGFMIWFASISDPNAEISGRRSGMKRLLNWLGYTIGPTWMSVIVGVIALFIIVFMVSLLIKRPQRQVLEF